MSLDLPEYATNPALAVSERQSWENQFREAMVSELSAHLTSLTAAGFPRWALAATGILKKLDHVPSAFLARLLTFEPNYHPEMTAEQIADQLAPTLATAAYNTHVLSLLAQHGIHHKMWVTRHDPKVRPAHAAADGQHQPLSKPFIVGGAFLQYPADSATAPISLWARCRCVIVGRRL